MFCSNCGKEILENTYFCSKCGVRTKSGVEAEIPIPKERKYDWKQELEQTFSKAGREIDKTLSNVGKELEKVFKTTKETKRELLKELI